MTQPVLMMSYQEQLHKYMLPVGEEKDLTIGKEMSDTFTFSTLATTYTIHWDGTTCQIDNMQCSLHDTVMLGSDDDQVFCYLLDHQERCHYDTANQTMISIGNNEDNDIQINALQADIILLRDTLNSPFTVYVQEGAVYHNYARIRNKVSTTIGDQLFIGGVQIVLGNGEISLMMKKERIVQAELTELPAPTSVYGAAYPDYHRSPRIIYREPEEKLPIAQPSSPPSKPSEELMRTIIPPIVMIAAFSLVTIFQPRGIYIIVMLAMTVTTVILSVTSYVKKSKQYKIDTAERIKSYTAYLERKTKELYEATEEQRHALHYHYPDTVQLTDMAMNIDARMYEKTMYHHDFLMYRVGLGNVDTSFEIDLKVEEFTLREDPLMDDASRLHNQFNRLEQVPVTASLTGGPVGYIGQRELVLEQLQLLIMQHAFFHSYHELQNIVIFPEEEKEKWDWMRWLPHASLKELNVRGFVYHDRSRDQVLNSLYQILKKRKQIVEEKEGKREKQYFFPHYVIFITDEKIVLDHTIMEFFNEDPSELGVSLIFVQDVLQSLPEHVETVIDIRDAKNGNVLLVEGELENQAFTPDHFPKHFDKEALSRALAPINHLQSLKSTIPEAVTFLEMYGIEKVEELTLRQNWAQNETYKSMAVPLGLRAKDDIVYLNLHEKAHGPHGLVAGTTGSGKSEIIQSYILSLAVYFHPYEVAFLLIDYKGGGMANLFKDLPHLLGTITNLDGAQSLRALASIKAELKRRQRLFGEYDVNHINEYQKLFKMGEAEEPMPHLYLISDEFAELKAEQPDFMKELVSTARIGRSLGIHLILATQKPSGVVDDQIWSNSKFKLALKVQNESDSNEVLKTPDAAEITLPGRAYLQVGNNEIYELFQSAWSGADYHPDQEDLQAVDTTVYAINDLGQYAILTKDLSGLDKQDEIGKTVTELEAVIEYIHAYTEAEEIEALPSPWLPPLEAKIYLQTLTERNFKELWEEPKQSLLPVIGMADFPDEQDQRPLALPLTKDGHVAVFSSPGYGKSTFLQTIVMDLARVHSPGDLHVYLLDFGTNGLLPLKDLPHVADTMLIDEDEKIHKLIRILESKMRARKKLLSTYGVATIDMYEKASGSTVPNIVVVLDNYDAVKEADFVEPFERMLTQLAREGSGIGVHLLTTASRKNALRVPLLSNIKTQLALYLIDDLEARSIVGKSQLEPEELQGRGLIKLEDVVAFQTALPVEAESTLDMITGIQKEAKAMNAHWQGERPEAIPMMPDDVISFADFKARKEIAAHIEQKALPLGLDYEDVKPLAFNFETYGNFIAVGDRLDRLERVRTTLAKNMLLLKDQYRTMLVDSPNKPLEKCGKEANVYVTETASYAALKKDLLKDIDYRIENNTTEPEWLIMIANFKEFATHSLMDPDEMIKLWEASNLGIRLIICSDYSYLGQSFEQIPKYVRGQALAGLLGVQLSDQDIFRQRFMSNEKALQAYEYYFAMDNEHIRIKIPE